MLFLSFTAVFIALLIYFFVGKALVSEKKIFIVQFVYIIFYFLFAPFLHIYNNIYALDFQFYNFKDAIISLNTVNTIGIIFAILGLGYFSYIIPRKKNVIKETNWPLLMKLSFIYFLFSLLYFIYLALTTNIFYVEAKTELESSSLFRYMVLESTPIVFAWFIVSYLKINNKKSFVIYFLGFILIAIIFSGLRGSRITVLFNVVSFVILYSSLIKKINYKYFILILILGFVFNTFYSNYKYSGIEGVKHYISTGEKSTYIENKDNKTLHFLLSDLARSDVQAKILENIELGQYKPPYIPETYINSMFLIVPDSLYETDLNSKRILGTEAIYGFKGNDSYSSSRIYGLLGESLINFGLYFIPIAFFIYGSIHYLTINRISNNRNSSFVLFIPLLFFIPIYFLFYDLDNIIFQIIKNWLFPVFLFLIYLGLNKDE